MSSGCLLLFVVSDRMFRKASKFNSRSSSGEVQAFHQFNANKKFQMAAMQTIRINFR